MAFYSFTKFILIQYNNFKVNYANNLLYYRITKSYYREDTMGVTIYYRGKINDISKKNTYIIKIGPITTYLKNM